jgi:two-component system chemotaxis sensor kinase CheA
MVPIAVVFNRFRRVVHDLSRELKKEVRLEIRGAETRLDRSLTESVAAPLMHVVRNSMDHGVESREVRLQAGKAASATIVLNAYQEAGEVIIEISDDGAGLNRGRIREHALAKNMIGPHEALSDIDTINLIFRPGFSTASQLTNVSGRGVGMDAVKRDIENLRGRVEVESREGSGTMIRFRLPLTLATIDGLLVRIHRSFCIVPLELVYECVEFSPSLIQSGSPNLINIRGEILPLVRLHDVFHMQSTAERRSIVVIHYSGQKAGLLVDELRGEIQSVVKAPGPILNNAGLKNGNSVLGDGSIATILDVLALLESMKQKEGSN